MTHSAKRFTIWYYYYLIYLIFFASAYVYDIKLLNQLLLFLDEHQQSALFAFEGFLVQLFINDLGSWIAEHKTNVT